MIINTYIRLAEDLSEEVCARRMRALAALPVHRWALWARRDFFAQLGADKRALFAAFKRLRDDKLFSADFYVVEKALLAVENLRENCPRDLPADAYGEGVEQPRVFRIAALLSGLPLRAETLGPLLEGYQDIAPLTMRELWVLPDMLRLALLKRVRILLEKSVRNKEEHVYRALQACVGALRELESWDAEKSFEAYARVEHTLARDPVYAAMDAPSRAYYRGRVAHIAKRLRLSENAVAQSALSLCEGREAHAGHVGYYLMDAGESELKAQLCPGRAFAPLTQNAKLMLFLLVQATLLFGLCFAGGRLWALLLLPAWSVANFVAVRLFLRGTRRGFVPRLQVTDADGTLVVLPTLIASQKDLTQALSQLETHYLSDPLPGAVYAVLGDFPDARSEDPTPEESAMLRLARARTAALNEKYPADAPRFFFLHRRREYHPPDRLYMGRERKRGALEDLLKHITTGADAPFMLQTAPLPPITHVLTLDADTILPRETLRSFVGASRHPLNVPVLQNGKVVRGYGVLLCAMRASAAGAEKSAFARIVSGDPGVDSYAAGVAEFYMDVFGAGVFGGKGLLDVAVFSAMAARIPPNSVLSHDLLEGCMARAGFMGDVALYDGEPTTCFAWWKRAHRWVRGDWQLLPFLPQVSPLSRYQILDNLRRSLTPVGTFAAVMALPWAGGGFMAVLLLSLFFAPLFDLWHVLCASRLWDRRGLLRERETTLLRALLGILVLPYAAYRTLDAVLRTLYRLSFSHTHMLEWQTAAQSGKLQRFADYLRTYWVCPAAGLALLLLRPGLAGVPFALFWLCAPWCLYGLDRPAVQTPLGQSQRALLMEIALRTWRFFETYASEETGYLPPDNVQEEPLKPPVPRTSPTNIGMALCAAICAYDLGFTDVEALFARLTHMCETLEKLPKWHGHLYNWYTLSTMEPCTPAYVSAVDSGNLVCSLLAAEQAALGLADKYAGDAAALAGRLRALATPDFTRLYDARVRLFHIGYDAESGKLSPSHYDLLASEARLLSFAAIALGQVEQRHWFTLGRLLTGKRVLVSWSGTLFEYLMPLLFTGAVSRTLLFESCRGATRLQADVGEPWGISESAYYAFDRRMYYQYRAFGLGALALCDSPEERVVAPYAAMLALLCAPGAAVRDLEALCAAGMLGEYGMYEALDFEASRVGDAPRRVCSYMAHHQGMGLCAIADVLRDGAIRRRFLRTPEVWASRLLLEEKPPLSVPIRKLHKGEKPSAEKPYPPRQGRHGDFPETQLLTNGVYTAFCSEDGRGYSRAGEVMLTRWRPESPQSGVQALFCEGGAVSALCGPDCESEYMPHMVCYRRAGDISARMQVCVSAQQDAEVREITLTNRTAESRTVLLGIFFEVCLATHAQDIAHPAFQKLRIEAEVLDGALLFRRRPVPGEAEAWLYCMLEGAPCRFCTDRLVMPGRGKSYAQALREPLPDTAVEAPLEPICHIRAEIDLPPGDAHTFKLYVGFARGREAALRALGALRRENTPDLAWAHARSALYFADVERGKADLYERMAGRVVLRCPMKEGLDGLSPEACAQKLRERTPGVEGLWALGISGDDPILLLTCSQPGHLRMARTLCEFAAYLWARGERCDVVLRGKYPRAYRSELREGLGALAGEHVYVLHDYDLSEETRLLLWALCLIDLAPTQPDRFFAPGPAPEKRTESGPVYDDLAIRKPTWVNGMGGFDTAAGEYAIALDAGQETPLPWCNMLVNPGFGAILTERGGGYAWHGNSRLQKLTPWHNDPVEDPSNERVRLLEQGRAWDILRDPAAPVCVRYGMGYAVYAAGARALHTRLTVFVDPEKPVKYMQLHVANPLMRRRALTLCYAVDWRLGDLPHPESLYGEYREGALRFYNLRTGQRGFMALDGGAPEGGGMGCAQGELRVGFTLGAGESRTFVLRMGGGDPFGEADAALAKVRESWRARLGVLRVDTGDPLADAMCNEWLPYQLESSRLLGRTGYYQCGGAIGFRDQLQDTLALKLVAPQRLRAQILLCAGMQFEAGDVLHWWHPGQAAALGVRTHIQDDRLFLPYAALAYFEATMDASLWEETVAYLADAPLGPDARDLYAPMRPGDARASVYAHCKAALQSIRTGGHGLALMEGGDWNDALDLVGAEGGESVWLSFFLLHILERFMPLAAGRGDEDFARACKDRAAALREACEAAWDGGWYRRAYYADGTPLGSRQSPACAMDCITQAWACICGAEHAAEAFEAMLGMLLDEEAGVLKLLSPPFSPEDEHPAGYIQSYVPGVRENGGQYTHGACWAVMAACALGRGETARKLWRMLLPVAHTQNEQGQKRYKGEPYVAAGDVYAGAHAGRAGWTWYTGAAGWLWSVNTEHILGIRRRGERLCVSPCAGVGGYRFSYRVGKSVYEISVEAGARGDVLLVDDGRAHAVTLCAHGDRAGL